MLFNSPSFILCFLPVALLGFYGSARLGHRWAEAWLVAVSFLFYAWWDASLVVLLCGSIAFNFTCGSLILRFQNRESTQRLLLALGLGGNLLLLFYYKYLFPLLHWLGGHGLLAAHRPFSSLGVALPLGISFFTFTQIGYLIDCKIGYLEDCEGGFAKSNRLLDYSLFVTFFPHLIAGPILHHREILPQFSDPKTYRFQLKNIALGSTLFFIGLAKKVLLADRFAPLVGAAFSHPHTLGFVHGWEAAFAYSLQLYFDFSGYSDMAVGLALMFGVRFPANFNSPFRAASIIDFWQRWHMTLTHYLTIYLYNPIVLAISRRRAARGKRMARQAIATPGGFLSLVMFPLFVTMGLAGIWHGAGLQFLVFGLLHAFYLTVNHAWRSFGPRVPETPPHPVLRTASHIAKVALTYTAAVVAFVPFRAGSLHNAIAILQGMAGIHFSANGLPPDFILEWNKNRFLFVALYGVIWLMPNGLQILNKYEPVLSRINPDSLIAFELKPNLAWGAIVGALAVLAMLGITGMSEFLYFKF